MNNKALTVDTPKAVELRGDVRELVAEWHAAMALRVRAGEVSKTTATTYTKGMSKFLNWLDVEAVSVGDEVISEWKAGMLEAGSKPAAVNTWLAGVRAFFAWAVAKRRLPYNPAAGVKGAKRKGTSQKHRRQALTDDEVRRLLARPDRETDAGKRDYALMCLMAYGAARTVELHRADVGDLRTEGGRLVLYVKGKGQAEADDLIVVAHKRVQDALYEWLGARGEKAGPLFTSRSNRSGGGRLSLPSIRTLVKSYMRQAGIVAKNKTTHSLRHSAISNAVRHGAPVQKAQAMARHANSSTTMIYYHETDRVENPAEQFIDFDNGGK